MLLPKNQNHSNLMIANMCRLDEFFTCDLSACQRGGYDYEKLKWVQFIRISPHEMKAKLVNVDTKNTLWLHIIIN